MSIHQISIWDNESLEEGYRQLSVLNFREAAHHFHEAEYGYVADLEGLQEAMAACRFWQSRLSEFPKTDDSLLVKYLDSMLRRFEQFAFNSSLKNFRKALLHYVVSLFYQTDEWEESHLITAFDLLLQERDYAPAESLIQQGMTLYPENHSLLCLQAQVLWYTKQLDQAKHTYIWIFLHHPDAVLMDRIVDQSFIKLIEEHGIYLTPAYAWLYKVGPYIHASDDLAIVNDEHGTAIECYQLIHLSDQAILRHDLQESIRHRKRMMELEPELYRVYYSRLEH